MSSQFASLTIGMMEQWNSGVMGSGIMQCWIDGPAAGGIDDIIKMAMILLNPPAADHHPTIPLSWQIQKPQNPQYSN